MGWSGWIAVAIWLIVMLPSEGSDGRSGKSGRGGDGGEARRREPVGGGGENGEEMASVSAWDMYPRLGSAFWPVLNAFGSPGAAPGQEAGTKDPAQGGAGLRGLDRNEVWSAAEGPMRMTLAIPYEVLRTEQTQDMLTALAGKTIPSTPTQNKTE